MTTKNSELAKRAEEAMKYLKANLKDFSDETVKGKTPDEIVALAENTKKDIAKREAEEAAAAESAKAFVTRAELDTALKAHGEALKNEIVPTIGTAVETAMRNIFAPEKKTDDAQRSDGKDKKDTGDAAQMGAVLGEAVRSAVAPVGELAATTAKTVETLGATMKGLADTVEKIAAQTVVRSEGEDGKQGKPKEKADVFRGVFALRGRPDGEGDE